MFYNKEKKISLTISEAAKDCKGGESHFIYAAAEEEADTTNYSDIHYEVPTGKKIFKVNIKDIKIFEEMFKEKLESLDYQGKTGDKYKIYVLNDNHSSNEMELDRKKLFQNKIKPIIINKLIVKKNDFCYFNSEENIYRFNGMLKNDISIPKEYFVKIIDNVNDMDFGDYGKLVHFDGDWYLFANNKWVSVKEKFKGNDIEKTIIRELMQLKGLKPELKLNKDKNTFFKKMIESKKLYRNHLDKWENNILFVAKNGYMDKDFEFHENEFPFSLSKLDINYNTEMKTNDSVDKYLNWMVNNNEERKKSLLSIVGSSFSERNDAIFGILYSIKHGTGKTTLTSLIKRITNGVVVKDAKTLFDGSKFNLTGVDEKHTGIIVDEIKTSINESGTNLIKSMCESSKKSISIENKGANAKEIPNKLTFIGTTNYQTKFSYIDNALKSRIVVINVGNDNKEYYLKDIKKIYETEALEYFLSIAIKEYMSVLKSNLNIEVRADNFRFNSKDSEKFFLFSRDIAVIEFENEIFKANQSDIVNGEFQTTQKELMLLFKTFKMDYDYLNPGYFNVIYSKLIANCSDGLLKHFNDIKIGFDNNGDSYINIKTNIKGNEFKEKITTEPEWNDVFEEMIGK